MMGLKLNHVSKRGHCNRESETLGHVDLNLFGITSLVSNTFTQVNSTEWLRSVVDYRSFISNDIVTNTWQCNVKRMILMMSWHGTAVPFNCIIMLFLSQHVMLYLCFVRKLQNEAVKLLLAFNKGNPPITGGCPKKKPVVQSSDISFVDSRTKLLIK